jgi:hypothetical protein
LRKVFKNRNLGSDLRCKVFNINGLFAKYSKIKVYIAQKEEAPEIRSPGPLLLTDLSLADSKTALPRGSALLCERYFI